MALMTKKAKLEQFDELKAAHDKLQLAVCDLAVAGHYRFMRATRVNVATEVDPAYTGVHIEISVSPRLDPLYMVKQLGTPTENYRVFSVAFYLESEIDRHHASDSIDWIVIRHGMWKMLQSSKETGVV
jgi:hypothetical protein